MSYRTSLALGAVALAAASGSAHADTVAFRPGYYAGGFVGWVNSEAKLNETLINSQAEPIAGEALTATAVTPGGIGAPADGEGFSGGALVGYSFIGNGLLLAIEGDLALNTNDTTSKTSGTLSTYSSQFNDNGNADNSLTDVTTTGGAFTSSSRFDSDGSIRGRVGTDIGYGMRIFATAGFAFGRVEHKVTASVTESVDVDAAGPAVVRNLIEASSKKWKAGWTLGGGVDVALWGPWSARVEYRYIDLGSTKIDINFADGSVQTIKFDDKEQVVRFGLVYAF